MSGSHLCIPINESVQCAVSFFPKQNYNVLSPNSYTPISVSNLYISRIGLSILLQPNMCGPILGIQYINRSQTHECGNWDGGRGIPRKGIHKWDFRCSCPLTYLPFLSSPSSLSFLLASLLFPEFPPYFLLSTSDSSHFLSLFPFFGPFLASLIDIPFVLFLHTKGDDEF